MTAKEYLMQLQKLDLKIRQKLRESSELRSIVQGRGMRCDSERVQTSPQNVQENTIIHYMDLENEIDHMIDDYVWKKDEVINQIHQLDDRRYIEILFEHYVPDINGKVKSLEEISVQMHYNYTYTCELHGQGLIAFEEIIRNNPKVS